MRTSSLLSVFAVALAGAGAIPACGGTVAFTGGGASGSGGTASTGAQGTGAVTTSTATTGSTSTGTATGGSVTTTTINDAGPPVDASPFPDSGAPEGGPHPEGGTTCPGEGDACTDCLSTSCSADYCSCYGNVDCGELLQCWSMCPPNDQACSQACETAHPDGISAALLLSGCAATQCPQGCPGNAPLSACDQCLYTNCAIEMNACVANPACVGYFDCTKACAGGPTCLMMCQTTYSTGTTDADKVSMCASVSCAGQCT